MDNLPPNFDPSFVEEPPVLICSDPECGHVESYHFAMVNDDCPDCEFGKLRPATAAERAEILAGHAEDSCEP